MTAGANPHHASVRDAAGDLAADDRDELLALVAVPDWAFRSGASGQPTSTTRP